MTLLLAGLMGMVAGLRAMMPLAALSWAASLGTLRLADTPLAFLGSPWTVGVLTLLALGELVTDQLPSTPSRTVPVQFGARIVTGAVAGAAIGLAAATPIVGAIAGALGAVLGTFGGAAARSRLAARFGQDRPAALLEDAVAIGGAVLVVLALR